MADWAGWNYDLKTRTNTAQADLTGSFGTWSKPLTGWTNYLTGSNIRSSPIVVGSYLYIGSDDGYLYQLNALTGALVNRYNTGNKVRSTPYCDGTTVVVGNDDGKVFAIDVGTWTLKTGWPFVTGARVRSSPIISGGVCFIGSDDGYMYAITISTGVQLWRTTSAQASRIITPIECGIALSGTNVYASAANGLVIAFATSNGAVTRTYKTQANSWVSSPSIATDGAGLTHLIVGASDHMYYDWNLSDGSYIWTNLQSGAIYSTPAIDVANNRVFFGNHKWNIESHHLDTGQLHWLDSAVASQAIQSSLAIAGGIVAMTFPPSDGRLVVYKVINATGGQAPGFKDPNSPSAGNQFGNNSNAPGQVPCSSPIIVNSKLYVGGEDGRVYAYG